jgi:hypothetical protein
MTKLVTGDHPELKMVNPRAAAIDIGSIMHMAAVNPEVIPPFLAGCVRRTYAAIFSFCAGVMPPMPMFGRSLL